MFILDRKGSISKADLLDSFKNFSKKIDICCISHDANLSINDVRLTEITQNICQYFINNESIDCSSEWRKFTGNYPMTYKIIKQYVKKDEKSFKDKIQYKIWKHLDKKLRKKGII